MAAVTNAGTEELGGLIDSLSALGAAGPGAPPVSRGETQIVVNPGAFVSGPTFTGTGFAFDAAGRPTGGTVTGFALPGYKITPGYGVSDIQVPLLTLYDAAARGAGGALVPDLLNDGDTFQFDTYAVGTPRGYDGDDLFLSSRSGQSWDGGAGVDTVVRSGLLRADATVDAGAESLLVVDRSWGLQATYTSVEAVRFADGTLSFDADTAGGQVYVLFRAALGRAPGAAELGYFEDAAERHGLPAAAAGLLATPEARAGDLGGLDSDDFIDAAYRAVLGRGADPDGSGHWRGRLDAAGGGDAGRGAVLAGIAASEEAEDRFAPELAAGVFGADPDTVAGVRAWLAATGAPPPTATSLASFGERPVRETEEFLARFRIPDGLSDAEFVALLVRNAYGPDASDPGAVAYYTQALGRGAGTRADVIHAYASSPGIEARAAPYVTDGGVLIA